MRSFRAFSLIELAIVVALTAILSVIAVATLSNYQKESRNRSALVVLETVAGAQESYHLDRGRWATSGDALTSFSSGGVAVTGSASTGANVVAVAEILVDGEDALGLAILDGNGGCLTLVVMPPESGEDRDVQRRNGVVCDGDAAGQP
jgi:prepilin-type N-terminal cleavage/methylation domain-containing protein